MTCLNYDALLLVKFFLFVLFWFKLSGSYRLSIWIYWFYCSWLSLLAYAISYFLLYNHCHLILSNVHRWP